MPSKTSLPSPLGLSTLGLGIGASLALAVTGGWLLGQEEAAQTGVIAIAAAAVLATHTIASVLRRLRRVIQHSSEALQQLSLGHNGFQLDTFGLPEFHPLLQSIHNLRELVEPTEAIAVEQAQPAVITASSQQASQPPQASPQRHQADVPGLAW